MRPANEALIVIDIQNDFCPGGALAVADGDAIIPRVNALMGDFAVVVLTQDWHPANHMSFAANHPGAAPFSLTQMPYGPQVLWPVHCVQGGHGAAFHAEDGARHARKDISTVGVASTLGIILLLLVVFRRFRALPITLLVVGAGYLGSLAAVLAVFPTVHMLTFVFGSAFVGVTADYAIYYLSTGPMTRWGEQAERSRMIFRPVTVCMITSAMGFGP